MSFKIKIKFMPEPNCSRVKCVCLRTSEQGHRRLFCHDTEGYTHKDTLALFKTAPSWTNPRICWELTLQTTLRICTKKATEPWENGLCVHHTQTISTKMLKTEHTRYCAVKSQNERQSQMHHCAVASKLHTYWWP